MQGSPPSKVKEMSTRLERSCGMLSWLSPVRTFMPLCLTTVFDHLASQKVLSLPELVILTINDLAVEDLHSASLVCRTWSEIALDHLWRTAVSLAPLLNTLASMQYSKEESNWVSINSTPLLSFSLFSSFSLSRRSQRIWIGRIGSASMRTPFGSALSKSAHP